MIQEAAVDPTIAAIVPITMMSGKLSNLESWLNSAVQNRIRVYLIHDKKDDATSYELLSITTKYDSKLITLIEGRFNSPGAARNFGLNIAKEEWVYFWDSDDLPNPTAARQSLQRTIEKGIQKKSIVVAQFSAVNAKDQSEIGESTYFFSDELNLKNLACQVGIWRIAFKRNAIQTLFNSTLMGEDQNFLLANLRIENTIFVSDLIYKYFIGVENQLTSNNSLMVDLWSNNLEAIKFLQDPDKATFVRIMIFKQLLTLVKKGDQRLQASSIARLTKVFLRNPFKSAVAFKIVLQARNFRNYIKSSVQTRVLLTGGLGNQLFQIAAAVSNSSSGSVLGVGSIGKPRLNKDGKIECLDFNYPFKVEIVPRNNRKIVTKIVGYSLRSGIYPSKLEEGLIYKKFVDFIVSIVLSIYLRKFTTVRPANNVGYFPLKKVNSRTLLIGYFQSGNYLLNNEQAISAFKKIHLKNPSMKFLELYELAQIESPIIVHIRLGDYLNEKTFGILGPKYYQDAIDKLSKLIENPRFWIFSDDIFLAKAKFENLFPSNSRWIFDELDNSSETLELMRSGIGFIIANSTFSWWAAFLAYNENCVVIAPNPWFKGENEPRDLIPKNWIRINADFNN